MQEHHRNSPWLHQVKKRHLHPGVSRDGERDVVIVGGGISGVMTAYYTLAHTQALVTLLEGHRIAHGATGHNAGQLVAEFEQSFLELVEKFGTEKAVDAEQDIDRAWTLLETLHREENLTTPMSTFTGYAAYESVSVIENVLKNELARESAGLEPRRIYLVESLCKDKQFTEYKHLFSCVSPEEIANLLETTGERYRAVVAKKRGCINSALLCEEIVHVLRKKYPSRFTLHEHTPVSAITLHPRYAELSVHNPHSVSRHVLKASRVILCTNGFESITIKSEHNPSFDTHYHETVRGLVGSMVGYVEKGGKNPTALSFHEAFDAVAAAHAPERAASYFYFTRRPFEIDEGQHSLVCVGGPDTQLDDTRWYDPIAPFDEKHREILDVFMKNTYAPYAGLQPRFAWHGLMGYTPTGMRIIGPDKKEKVLWYNLGCNGIGLMTAIFGGYKIGQMLKGEKFPLSAFDPS
jgi:glycine/D-amino acid oxidase-like deaminating enzyme